MLTERDGLWSSVEPREPWRLIDSECLSSCPTQDHDSEMCSRSGDRHLVDVRVRIGVAQSSVAQMIDLSLV